ncbi:DUF2141 domain-containing protein [Sphingomonas sp.]|uniref:DUF2141 domain-containing protein n=1 Tax=Sphingomonas sp. TaxID=28214 RepID=UPI003B3A404F
MMPLLLLAAAASAPPLGVAAGTCHADAGETQIRVDVQGLKDRAGRLRLELYPPNDSDFLADDTILIKAGKSFARVDLPTPPAGPVNLCIRAPEPGRYAIVLLHDRNSNHRFDFAGDGIGFAGNPRLGWSRPRATAATVTAGAGHTDITIVLNYLHGLSMRPEK